jgi:hypothetical protein
MERKTAQPLNPEQAKARLRAAATEGEAYSWVWRCARSNATGTALGAFIAGFVIGTSSTAREALANGMVALLKRSGAQLMAPVRDVKR